MHVILDRLPRGFRRRGKQRSDIDVEAEIGEGGGDDLLGRVVAVLTDLGDENAGPASLGALECVDQCLHVPDLRLYIFEASRLSRSPEMDSRISARWRPTTFSSAIEDFATVAFAPPRRSRARARCRWPSPRRA